MKSSKFIKDLFTTGLTQILVLLFGIILLRIMASALSKEYFGILMVIRKAIAVGVPLTTLNLSVGLARYVSYEREKEREFLNASLWAVGSLSSSVIFISIIFRNRLSLILFNSTNYSLFVVLTACILLSYGIFTISYAFLRGRQEMIRANKIQIFYHIFPVLTGLILFQLYTGQYYKILSYYLILFFLGGFALGAIYILKSVHFYRLLAFMRKIPSVKVLFFYSLSRIPSSFFLALIFGTPVFFATHKMSLVAAGYVGIMVAIIRLMGIFVTPFNLLFLPKFAEIKRDNSREKISANVSIIINFIMTALPFIAVACYGLAKYAVIVFFGNKYIPAVQGVSAVILFSTFYASYVLIRGILDGLFSFPYVNVICLLGFLTTAISSFFFHGSVFMLALDLCLGLFVMGATALCVLIKMADVPVRLNELLQSLIITLSTFILLYFLDKWVELAIISEFTRLGAQILFRLILFLTIFWLYWKPKSVWAKEILLRIK